MRHTVLAGAAYFAGVFALGFVLGTIRVLFVAPVFGEWAATIAELPVMLALSWIYCRWLLRHIAVPHTVAAGLAMGLLAFTLLIAAEYLIGTTLFGRLPLQQLDAMTGGPGLLGLMAQVAFAFFPLAQLRHGGTVPRR